MFRDYVFELLILLLIFIISPLAFADEKIKVDYLSLSALMIKEGDYIKAAKAIKKIDENDEKLDKKRYYTLRGLISLNRELFQKSISEFESAIAAGQKNKIIYVYLAQDYMGMKNFSSVLTMLDKADELEKNMPGIWLLRSQAHWLNNEKHLAWNVLGQAEKLFPDEKTFMRNKIFYAIELGLFQQAVELGKKYIKQHDASVTDYVSLGDALRRSAKPQSALNFLELARLKFPEEKNIYLAMAHAYIDLDNVYAAAMILEEGGEYNNALFKDSAELYKQVNDTQRALFNNSKVLKQKEKLRQRMALQLQSENFDQVLAMEDELLRVRLLDDDTFLYAIAYAHYKLGDYHLAEASLEKITDAKVFRKAAELRKLMAGCANEKWLC